MSTAIFVTVGTDHHPFARLVDWVDAWAQGRDDVTLLVQHGATRASVVGRNLQFLDTAQLRETYDSSDVVVAQVGPGSIADANRVGLVPIVVPRDPALGEVVDSHQFDFGRFMASKGRADVVTTEDELRARLDAAVARPAGRRIASLDVQPVVDAVEDLAQRLVAGPRRRVTPARILAMARRVKNR